MGDNYQSACEEAGQIGHGLERLRHASDRIAKGANQAPDSSKLFGHLNNLEGALYELQAEAESLAVRLLTVCRSGPPDGPIDPKSQPAQPNVSPVAAFIDRMINQVRLTSATLSDIHDRLEA